MATTSGASGFNLQLDELVEEAFERVLAMICALLVVASTSCLQIGPIVVSICGQLSRAKSL
jgi:hypothetical protein